MLTRRDLLVKTLTLTATLTAFSLVRTPLPAQAADDGTNKIVRMSIYDEYEWGVLDVPKGTTHAPVEKPVLFEQPRYVRCYLSSTNADSSTQSRFFFKTEANYRAKQNDPADWHRVEGGSSAQPSEARAYGFWVKLDTGPAKEFSGQLTIHATDTNPYPAVN